MSERPSSGLGKRLGRYRRMAGLSAQQLSEEIGGEMSRGVIANIESGRKRDVTVDQLVALAWALRIPPVVLALPVDEPNRFVKMHEGENTEAIRSSGAVRWFNADPNAPYRSGPTGLTALSFALLKALHELDWALAYARLTRQKFELGTAEQDRLDEAESDLAAAEQALRHLGADLTMYDIDE